MLPSTNLLVQPSKLENDLLHLHLVEHIIALDCLRKRHDLICHEPAIDLSIVVKRRQETEEDQANCVAASLTLVNADFSSVLRGLH